MSPIIDDTGKFLAFEAREKNVPSIFASVEGGQPKRLCTGCSLPTSWFDSNRAILYREGSPSSINMIDPRTGKHRLVLKQDAVSLSEPSWSPKTEYLLFTRQNEGEGNKQIFAVRLPKATASVKEKWIPITEASESAIGRGGQAMEKPSSTSLRATDSLAFGANLNPEAGRRVDLHSP